LLELAQSQAPAVPAWLAVLLAALVPLAAALGKRLGMALVTNGKDFIEAKLKAAKHDELVPVVESLVHGLLDGAHDPSLDAAVERAAENGSIDHPVIQRVISAQGTAEGRGA
jgi:hypothetical protein